MMRQYKARRFQGGDNPLRVGTIAAGSIYYVQGAGPRGAGDGPACRTPWIVEGFLNGALAAARRDRATGRWEDAFLSGRSDVAVVRSLRDRRDVRRVAVRELQACDDEGLSKGETRYPALPDLRFHPRLRPA